MELVVSTGVSVAGGYFVIAPSHRGRRLQRPLWELTFAQARDAGVSGLLGRFAYTARTPVPSLRAGWQFIGPHTACSRGGGGQ